MHLQQAKIKVSVSINMIIENGRLFANQCLKILLLMPLLLLLLYFFTLFFINNYKN